MLLLSVAVVSVSSLLAGAVVGVAAVLVLLLAALPVFIPPIVVE